MARARQQLAAEVMAQHIAAVCRYSQVIAVLRAAKMRSARLALRLFRRGAGYGREFALRGCFANCLGSQASHGLLEFVAQARLLLAEAEAEAEEEEAEEEAVEMVGFLATLASRSMLLVLGRHFLADKFAQRPMRELQTPQ